MKLYPFFLLLITTYITYGQVADKTVTPGDKAPGFTLIDDSNEEVPLSDFKGKVVLIDFWASYCGPCRQQYQTFLKPLYEYLKTTNFEIIGITLDKDVADWLNAIEKDEIPWPQLSASLNTNSVLSDYRVSYIPQIMLIDVNGNLIGKNFTKYELVLNIYNHINNKDISTNTLESIASKYISWEEFWVDIDYEVKKYLYENTNYPKAAQENNVAGCIPVIVRIGKDFRLEYGVTLEYVPGTQNQQKVKNLGFGCEEEVRRVIDSMTNWKSWPYVQKEYTYNFTVDVCFPPKPPVRKRVDEFKYN